MQIQNGVWEIFLLRFLSQQWWHNLSSMLTCDVAFRDHFQIWKRVWKLTFLSVIGSGERGGTPPARTPMSAPSPPLPGTCERGQKQLYFHDIAPLSVLTSVILLGRSSRSLLQVFERRIPRKTERHLPAGKDFNVLVFEDLQWKKETFSHQILSTLNWSKRRKWWNLG